MAVTRPEARVHAMTYPTQPARSGMPTWAKWTMIGCAGCLTVVILGVVGCGALIYQYFGMKTIDMSDKPDPPATATPGQLLPAKVGPFVRGKVGRYIPSRGSQAGVAGWQATYVANHKRAMLLVMSTTAAQAARERNTPFGKALQRQNNNPGMGIHMTIKKGPQPMDMVVWSKPNWTFTVQSPDMIAEQFARAYQPKR
jgi:hypothetical protein